jgi:hypothetical protein
LQACGITEEDDRVKARLGARWAEALRVAGVEVLDTTEPLRAAGATPQVGR